MVYKVFQKSKDITVKTAHVLLSWFEGSVHNLKLELGFVLKFAIFK